MNNKNAEGERGFIRTYFSHSYRTEDKHRNLFFWELFSKEGFYFTVDRKPEIPTPMYISYLEWLMRRSTCFISVVPRRSEPDSPYNCSRYQIFENGLAIRARKPRLIFVEDGLPEYLFRGSEEEICVFHPTRYREQEKQFQAKAKKLVQKALAYLTDIVRAAKPVALLVNPSQEAYSPKIIEVIRQTVRQCKYVFGDKVNPYFFPGDSLFALDIEQYEVLISEVRQPYIPLDVFAWVHSRCVPTIRICHLEEGETAEQAAREMHLSYREELWMENENTNWPVILSGYQLDAGMKPVIFWHTVDELTSEIASQLRKIEQSTRQGTEELFSILKARRYFLSIGRRDQKVFISNAHSQNELGMVLSKRLREEEGVRTFHYKDLDAIPVGTRDWLQSVYHEIDESGVFVAILDEKYFGESEWCKMEIERALPSYKRGELIVFPYVVEPMEWPRDQLELIEGKYLTEIGQEQQLKVIVDDIVKHLERSVEDSTQLGILYDSGTSQLGTFSGIEKNRLKGVITDQSWLNVELYDVFRRAVATYDWHSVISAMGNDLLHEIFQERIRVRYSEALRFVGHQKRLVRFCFATDVDGFVIPFEWMKTSDRSLPLGLEHPVNRFLIGYPKPRSPLGELQKKDIRLLLIASNTGSIPRVDDEIDDLEKYFVERFGLPEKNICKLGTQEATYKRMEQEITEGGCHILHFAGHGGCDERGPYIRVLRESRQTADITAPVLKEWIGKSDLRFVYMSNCQSADMRVLGDQMPTKFKFNPIRGITQAIVEAGVPEVIGFSWSIPDTQSRHMASIFYQYLVRGFDSAVALFEARRVFAVRDARIWAAPILIRQF
jgi:hypothetical protein